MCERRAGVDKKVADESVNTLGVECRSHGAERDLVDRASCPIGRLREEADHDVASAPPHLLCRKHSRDLVVDWVDEYTKLDERARYDPSFQVNTGPTSALATQIINGAEFDLFLSANRDWAEKVAAAGSGRTAIPLLSNRLVVIIPNIRSSYATIRMTSPRRSLRVLALAGENVPAGIYADQALQRSGSSTN